MVVYGYQGASHHPEAFAKTGLLFEAVRGELAAVAFFASLD